MRWGLIGASDIAATSLIPAIRAQPDGEVVAVHSRSPERGAAYAHRHGIARSTDRLDDLLADPDVEAVYVSTTNDRHRDETLAAARTGRHVLCEKPLAPTVEDARTMVDACREAAVVLATNHGRRNDPLFRTAQRLVAEGAVGRPLVARSSNTVLLPERLRGWRLHDPAAGAGVVLDVVVHEADTLRFVLGDEPVEVTALTAQQGLGAGTVEDAASGVLRMASGLLASFTSTFTTPYGEVGIEVHGSEGSLYARRGGRSGPASVVLRRQGGDEVVELGAAEPVGVATVRAFEAAVRGEGPPSATGADGLCSLAVAQAALESARTVRAVPVGR